MLLDESRVLLLTPYGAQDRTGLAQKSEPGRVSQIDLTVVRLGPDRRKPFIGESSSREKKLEGGFAGVCVVN